MKDTQHIHTNFHSFLNEAFSYKKTYYYNKGSFQKEYEELNKKVLSREYVNNEYLKDFKIFMDILYQAVYLAKNGEDNVLIEFFGGEWNNDTETYSEVNYEFNKQYEFFLKKIAKKLNNEIILSLLNELKQTIKVYQISDIKISKNILNLLEECADLLISYVYDKVK